MLIPQNAQGQTSTRHGCRDASLSELRQHLAKPSALSDGQRQRLLDLARRAARVQAMGDEYARVEPSHHVTTALAGAAVA